MTRVVAESKRRRVGSLLADTCHGVRAGETVGCLSRSCWFGREIRKSWRLLLCTSPTCRYVSWTWVPNRNQVTKRKARQSDTATYREARRVNAYMNKDVKGKKHPRTSNKCSAETKRKAQQSLQQSDSQETSTQTATYKNHVHVSRTGNIIRPRGCSTEQWATPLSYRDNKARESWGRPLHLSSAHGRIAAPRGWCTTIHATRAEPVMTACYLPPK